MAPKAILVVEDDPGIGELILEVLNDIAGYHATRVPTGAAALAVAGVNTDLIILDVRLPDLSGFAVYDLLRARLSTATTPMLFMTAGRHDAEFAQRGVSSWLPKPFVLKDLVERVDALLAPGAAA